MSKSIARRWKPAIFRPAGRDAEQTAVMDQLQHQMTANIEKISPEALMQSWFTFDPKLAERFQDMFVTMDGRRLGRRRQEEIITIGAKARPDRCELRRRIIAPPGWALSTQLTGSWLRSGRLPLRSAPEPCTIGETPEREKRWRVGRGETMGDGKKLSSLTRRFSIWKTPEMPMHAAAGDLPPADDYKGAFFEDFKG